MKDYTLVFLAEPGQHTATINIKAHCEKCAFNGSLKELSNLFKEGSVSMVRCVAMFSGLHDNVWPEFEDDIAKSDDRAVSLDAATILAMRKPHDGTVN